MNARQPLGPKFGRFLGAAAASNLGDGIRLGALPLLALSLTDDARLVALGKSVRQAVTPEHLLGRVIATFRMFAMGAAPVGAILGGIVAEAAGVRAAFVIAAAVEVISWGILLAALRHLDDAPAAAVRSQPDPGVGLGARGSGGDGRDP